jgi:endonuclease-3 related protein
LGIEDQDREITLREIYGRLFAAYGPQHWWPADEPFEVIVGAILTQSTAWSNVEKAIAGLKAADAITPAALHQMPIDHLARLIRPSGYYNAKARKLKAFVERLLSGYDGNLGKLFSLDTVTLRRELLSIHGVGEETADSIILYAARRPVFVIDAYTRRIFSRLDVAPPDQTYGAYQQLFTRNLSPDEALFNEYHALLVRHGKDVCRRVPRCDDCCLAPLCLYEA